MRTLARQWSARRVLVDDAVTGTALVQELREEISGIIAVKPVGDKASRMAVASAKFEAGQVFLLERAEWLPDLEAELFAFPAHVMTISAIPSVKRCSTGIGICRWKLLRTSWLWRRDGGDLSCGSASQGLLDRRAVGSLVDLTRHSHRIARKSRGNGMASFPLCGSRYGNF